ncbi:MAG: aminoacyl-tRNA hydrolase [Oscillospiraceae bacterium]|nr:aminoacyl-tRNA hydrolase [Oscillospiraceae bacterium]
MRSEKRVGTGDAVPSGGRQGGGKLSGGKPDDGKLRSSRPGVGRPGGIWSRLFGSGGGGSGSAPTETWLIVGLGNPGGAYEATRHNVGFRTIDAVSGAIEAQVQKKRFSSLVGEGRFEGKKIVLIKPQTFMNASGEAVRQALRFYKTGHGNMIVVYDDVDIDLGKIRLRAFGGTGSHNGMRSISDHIGEGAKFPRIRIGIGKQPKNMELRDFVLKRFTAGESALAEAAVSDAAAAALDIVRYGIEKAMNTHNPKRQGAK